MGEKCATRCATVGWTTSPDNACVTWPADFGEGAAKRLLLFAIIIGTLLLAPMAAQADAVTFTAGAATTDWNTKGNWSPARVPTESDDVTIPSGQTVTNEPFASLGTGFINSLTLLGTLTIDTAGLSLQSTMAPSTTNNLILTSTSTYSVLTMQGPTTFTGYLALSPGPNRRSMLVTYQHRFCLGRCSQTNRG